MKENGTNEIMKKKKKNERRKEQGGENREPLQQRLITAYHFSSSYHNGCARRRVKKVGVSALSATISFRVIRGWQQLAFSESRVNELESRVVSGGSNKLAPKSTT
jgi:hypothetical protein